MYRVQSPDEPTGTSHRNLNGAVRRINWLINRGHSDIDLAVQTKEGADMHFLINENPSRAELAMRITQRASELGWKVEVK